MGRGGLKQLAGMNQDGAVYSFAKIGQSSFDNILRMHAAAAKPFANMAVQIIKFRIPERHARMAGSSKLPLQISNLIVRTD